MRRTLTTLTIAVILITTGTTPATAAPTTTPHTATWAQKQASTICRWFPVFC